VRQGLLPGIESPAALAPRLPGLYLAPQQSEPNLAQRFLAALDDVLAPVFLALDCLPAYLDPMLAPEDFLDWLAGWLGLAFDERWSLDRRRALVSRAAALYQMRGTAEGVAQCVDAFYEIRPDVSESGGVAWSTTAEGPLPGEDSPRLTVRVPAGHGIDMERLRALVDAIRPAHIAADVVVG
jgi:phage tail-like protein